MNFSLVSLCVFCVSTLSLHSSALSVFQDRLIVEKVDRQIQEKFPVFLNHQLQGGYFETPSAFVLNEANAFAGFALCPPYHIWSLGFQYLNRLELTGNYWVYQRKLKTGNDQTIQSPFSERAFNAKFVLFKNTHPFDPLPNVAFGWNDILGSNRFTSLYLVASKQWYDLNLEASLGFGFKRMNGFFGAVSWYPFKEQIKTLKDLRLTFEYNPNDAFIKKKKGFFSSINYGAHLAFFNEKLQVSVSSLKNKELGSSVSFHYPIGASDGLIAKIHENPLYLAPIDNEPIGIIRSRQDLAQELCFAFLEQGFDLYKAYLITKKNHPDDLWLKVINTQYRDEADVRCRIEYLLAAILPSNIEHVTVVIETDGLSLHEYRYRNVDLQRFVSKKISTFELQTVATRREVQKAPNPYDAIELFNRNYSSFSFTLRPWVNTFLGTNTGKFEYELGLVFNPEGYLFNQIYYNLSATYTAKSSTQPMQSVDLVNPSYLLQVRTDSLFYNQTSSLHLEKAYLQMNWNLKNGYFARASFGYFETAYFGAAVEALLYPVDANWAIGISGGAFLKRGYYGIGFQPKIRKLSSSNIQYVPFVGHQTFVDFYYQYPALKMDFKASIGQFLAKDVGLRLDAAKVFDNGIKLGFWYTFTNAHDKVNGSVYFDKGFNISLPLDLFLTKSSRKRISYGMSLMLRDSGAIAATGKQLYPMIYWERFRSNL